MKRLIIIISLLSPILLVGCTAGTPTKIPTKTTTPELFIHVPTPTILHAPTSSATLEPTQEITGTSTVSTTTPIPTPTPKGPSPRNSSLYW